MRHRGSLRPVPPARVPWPLDGPRRRLLRDLGGQRLRGGWVYRALAERVSAGDAPRLLVVHVPKTGGSSLRSMLAAHVPPERTFLSGSHEWVDRSPAQLRDAQLFVGHNFLEPLYLFPRDRWVTVLPVREPVAWWQSYYKHLRRRAALRSEPDRTRGLPFGTWVDTLGDHELANPQVSWLFARMRLMFDNELAPAARMGTTGVSLARRPRDVVRVLDRFLARVTVLGTTDDVHDLYLGTCAAMGWEPVHERAAHENVIKEALAAEVTPAQERRLRSVTRIDRYVYERALQAASTRAAGRGAPPPVPADVPAPGPVPAPVPLPVPAPVAEPLVLPRPSDRAERV